MNKKNKDAEEWKENGRGKYEACTLPFESYHEVRIGRT